jgi:hypothetical protein
LEGGVKSKEQKRREALSRWEQRGREFLILAELHPDQRKRIQFLEKVSGAEVEAARLRRILCIAEPV